MAHASENVLGKIRDKVLAVSPDAVSLILESLDAIKSIVAHLSEHESEPEGTDAGLIARLDAFAAGDASGSQKKAESLPQAKTAPYRARTSTPPPPPLMSHPGRKLSVPTAAGAEPAAYETPGQTQSIRVAIGVLDTLMQTVGELVLTRNQLLQMTRAKSDPFLSASLQSLSHITTELQEGIMKTRMQPIGTAWSKFPRLIRDLSLEMGKRIELRMEGAETELDRQLLELIRDPLTHMVRNSADHGLEGMEARRAAGKPETGVITLSASHEGGHIIIQIADDGRGMDVTRIRRKALENGLGSEAEIATLSDQQVMQFIFPGRLFDGGKSDPSVGARRRHGRGSQQYRKNRRRGRTAFGFRQRIDLYAAHSAHPCHYPGADCRSGRPSGLLCRRSTWKSCCASAVIPVMISSTSTRLTCCACAAGCCRSYRSAKRLACR